MRLHVFIVLAAHFVVSASSKFGLRKLTIKNEALDLFFKLSSSLLAVIRLHIQPL